MSTGELLLHIWGAMIPGNLILRMAVRCKCNYALLIDEEIEAWRGDMTWWLPAWVLSLVCVLLKSTTCAHDRSSIVLLLRGWKNGEACGLRVGCLRKEALGPVRYSQADLPKKSRNGETLASDITSPPKPGTHLRSGVWD